MWESVSCDVQCISVWESYDIPTNRTNTHTNINRVLIIKMGTEIYHIIAGV